MKSILKFILIFLPLVSFEPLPAANLLVNGDFSNWLSPREPYGWIVEDTTKAKIEQETSLNHSEPYSCKITRLVTGTGNNYGLKQYITVTPETIYTFSSWFYDDDINARGGLLITWCRGDSSAIRSTSVVYTDSSIHTWQRLVRTDTAPDSAVYARCLLRVYGFTGGPAGGVIYVDDAQFVTGSGGINQFVNENLPHRRLLVIPEGTGELNIALTLDFSSWTSISIYDLAGNERQRLYTGKLSTGTHRFRLDNNEFPQGVFFVVTRLTDSEPLVSKFVIGR